jgi:hypothetical protein
MADNTARPNYFEDLVDDEMIRLVANGDESIIEFLTELDQDEQRPAILSIIDRNMGLFDKIMAIMNGEYIPKATHISNVVEMLRKYVEVGEVEKKKFGEVMTPIWLVEDMINKLPEEVWSNPDLKWLDPCNGCGIFPSVIVKRLMEGLREWEPEEDKRYKHIMENMIYVCELQAKNMFLYLCAFDPEDVYLLNIFHGSFLSEEFDRHMKNEWKVEKFDVIIGNPPYQELKPGFSKSQAIWPMFVERGLSLCEKGGLFSMIHPPGWRNVDGRFKKIQHYMLGKKVIYLEMHDTNDGIKNFGATTPYDWYVIENLQSEGNITEIKCINGFMTDRCLDDYQFVPGAMFDEIFNLIANENEEKRVDVLHSYSAYETRKEYISKEKDDIFKYPCVDNIGDKTNAPTKIYWSNINNKGHFGIPKLIWSALGPGIFIDEKGHYGMTQHGIAIHDSPENLNKIKKAMHSDSFQKIMQACKVGGLAGEVYNHKVIALFRHDFWKEFVDEA